MPQLRHQANKTDYKETKTKHFKLIKNSSKVKNHICHLLLGSPFLKIAATVASCQDVGTEPPVQTLLHKRTAHGHAGELYIHIAHIAFQNSGGIPSEPAAFRRFRDFTDSTTSASDMEVLDTNNGSSHVECSGSVVARGAHCTDSK